MSLYRRPEFQVQIPKVSAQKWLPLGRITPMHCLERRSWALCKLKAYYAPFFPVPFKWLSGEKFEPTIATNQFSLILPMQETTRCIFLFGGYLPFFLPVGLLQLTPHHVLSLVCLPGVVLWRLEV